MSGGYIVTAPVAIAADQSGKLHHRYHGAWIPWLNDEQREHFLRKGLVREVEGAGAHVASAPEASPRPAKTAPAEKWVEYGVAVGHSREELSALSKQELVELLG